jgi:putative transposase
MAPREAFQKGVAQSGVRSHCTIDYDDTFRFFSLPSTPKGTAKVRPGSGVKINYLYYWSDEFRPSTIENTQVAVRYDPCDISVAYAFVRGHWVPCISEYYLQFKDHSERELLLATAELRKRLQEQAKHQAITAKRLAEFLADAREHEAVLMQRQRDAEAQDVFAQLGGYRKELPQIEAPTPPTPAQRPMTEQEPSEEETDVYAGLEVYEEYR